MKYWTTRQTARRVARPLSHMIILVIFLSIAGKTNAQVEDALSQFDAGTALLIDGQFSEALAQFEKIEALEWSSPELFYNMGLAHHRMDRLGEAIRYLEKARHLSPDDPRILHSLTVATSRRADSFSELPEPFWKRSQAWALRTVPITPAFWIGILAYLALIGLLVAKHVLFVEGDWFRRSRLAAGVVGGIFLLHAFTSSAWPPFNDRAVVLADRIELLEQADSEAEQILDVHEGLVVIIKAQASDWTFIQIPNGSRGWVPTNTLGEI